MVYSTGRFVVCLSVCLFVLVFFSPFGIAISSLGEEGAGWSWCFSYVCSVCACLGLSDSSSSWGLRGGGGGVCGLWLWHSLGFCLAFFDNYLERILNDTAIGNHT